jgi:hypothetical protein
MRQDTSSLLHSVANPVPRGAERCGGFLSRTVCAPSVPVCMSKWVPRQKYSKTSTLQPSAELAQKLDWPAQGPGARRKKWPTSGPSWNTDRPRAVQENDPKTCGQPRGSGQRDDPRSAWNPISEKVPIETLFNVIQDGGPILYHNDSEEQERSFESTCNKFRRFLQGRPSLAPAKRRWK